MPTPFRGEIPSWGRKTLEHSVFCAVGGGGSTALATQLGMYARFVGVRPDNWFLPAEGFDRIMEHGAYHVGAGELDRPLNWLSRSMAFDLHGVVDGVHVQSGYRLDSDDSLEQHLDGYLSWLRGHEGVAVFWQLPSLCYLTIRRVQRVVFLLRRPLDTWQSFTAEHRHAALFDQFGGRETPEALAVFCRWWSAIPGEMVRLQEMDCSPVLIRYDHAEQDAPPELHHLFARGSGWAPRTRSDDDAPPLVRQFIAEQTGGWQQMLWPDG